MRHSTHRFTPTDDHPNSISSQREMGTLHSSDDPDAQQRQEQESSVNTEGRDNTQPRPPNVQPTPGFFVTVPATGDFGVRKRQKVTPPAVAPAQKFAQKSKKKSKKTVRCVDSCGVKVTEADADSEGVWDTEHEDWTCDDCKDDSDDEEDNESDDDEDDESDDDEDDGEHDGKDSDEEDEA